MRGIHLLVCFVTAVLLASFAIGCSKSRFPVASNVSGIVTLNGNPVEEATVLFQPEEKGNPGPPSSGKTDEEGKFTLAFADGKPGAVIGKHRVIVSTRRVGPRKDNPDAEEEIAPEKIPVSYLTKPFTLDIPKGGTDEANIDLIGASPQKKPAGPQRPSNG